MRTGRAREFEYDVLSLAYERHRNLAAVSSTLIFPADRELPPQYRLEDARDRMPTVKAQCGDVVTRRFHGNEPWLAEP